MSELMPITGREFGYGGDKHQDGKKIKSVYSTGTGIQYNVYGPIKSNKHLSILQLWLRL